MSQKKLIAVFGATGAQGGGLAHAILGDPNSEFSVRAVTRDVNSEKAKALAAMGAEVVSANIDDIESIKRVLQGAYGAYFVTFFWEHFSVEKEMTEAKNMATAAKESGLQHVIWSTLEDVRKFVPLSDNSLPTLQEKYKVPHFDGKGESDHFFTDAGVPVTFLLTSFYWENLIYFGMGPKKDANGKLAITFPLGNKKMAGISSEDIGKCAYGIFKKGKELIGKRIGISGDQITCSEMAEKLSKKIGQEVVYNEVTPDQYRNFGFPGAEDLGNMFQFYRDFEGPFNGVRDMKFAKELNPELQSFDSWVEKNASRIPIE
ncbi:putative oxidoreductase [Flavobacterium limnosediminis JC2902]|uniref:Putative oxidoreductase n=1 Tax=Flavobacterium limnosediminis JC2902 TaxID=1341181 RepID=V6SFE5_9FLAO|nr:NmrA/HSCARG family protein [Flavobacterium limnosediminis]ESU25296.1 putative oxidoreductase [Flavobacterium limnosediminis JC2902]